MKIFRIVLNGFAAFICVTSIVGLVYLFTLQATVMDRDAVKGWLSDSKIYEGNLIASLIQPAATTEPVPTQMTLGTSPEMMKTALNATFTPDFIREQVEGVIDNTYDWVEGKNPELTFSIPIDQQRDTFIQQLSKTLEPQIAALPICGSVQADVCRPASLTVEQLASQMTTQSIDESGMFAAPLTPASFPQDTQQPTSPLLAQLPALREIVDLLFIILPIIIILSVVTIIFATQPDRRLTAAVHLSRRIVFSMLFTLIPAAIVMFLLKDNDFGLSQMFAAQIGDLIVPLIKIVIVDIAYNLVLFSGITAMISAAAWITLAVWQKKIKETRAFKNPSFPTRY